VSRNHDALRSGKSGKTVIECVVLVENDNKILDVYVKCLLEIPNPDYRNFAQPYVIESVGFEPPTPVIMS
jgi:hypothetical protein